MVRLKTLAKQAKGFTLLELIVVIAIIGLVASILLVSISQSQRTSEDRAIIRDLDQVRKEAEAFYVERGNYEGMCAPDGSLAEKGYFKELEKSIEDKQGEIECRASVSEYAVSASLQEGGYWCVDWHGVSEEIGSSITDTSCP